jgi:hypothetical protein
MAFIFNIQWIRPGCLALSVKLEEKDLIQQFCTEMLGWVKVDNPYSGQSERNIKFQAIMHGKKFENHVFYFFKDLIRASGSPTDVSFREWAIDLAEASSGLDSIRLQAVFDRAIESAKSSQNTTVKATSSKPPTSH